MIKVSNRTVANGSSLPQRATEGLCSYRQSLSVFENVGEDCIFATAALFGFWSRRCEKPPRIGTIERLYPIEEGI